MAFSDELRSELEREERESVGKSFGGTGQSRSYSVPRIRDWVLQHLSLPGAENVRTSLTRIALHLNQRGQTSVVASALRYSFLIELTDLKVGSTKMKTRWVPGRILMPQDGSFEPVQGVFEPGNDPRAETFETCFEVFEAFFAMTADSLDGDASAATQLMNFAANTRVPYEFPVAYRDAHSPQLHSASNTCWCFNDDARWLAKARPILAAVQGEDGRAIKKIENSKLSVKVYKTDRALTGKDKTNRAKRWEVLPGDFQQASLQECWSVERKLTEQLVCFANFLPGVKAEFVRQGLIAQDAEITRCPVTLATLDYLAFSATMLAAQHGRSDYQIGHMMPLKRGGRHVGDNVSWQSADGNRIQGDLSLNETRQLLLGIRERSAELGI